MIGSELIVKIKSMGLGGASGKKADKTIFKASLNEIKTTSNSGKYKVDPTKLKDEKEITITAPVEVAHPVNYILLPHSKTLKTSSQGQMWSLRAVGGSGSYTWRSANLQVANIGSPPHVKAGDVGVTVLTVSDLHNPDNFATIPVEV